MRNFFYLIAMMVCMTYAAEAQQTQDSTQLEQGVQKAEDKIEQAADFAQRNINFGLKAGLNFASLNSNEVLNSDPLTGIHLGFFARYQVTSMLGAKVELLYSMQGARDDEFSIFDGYSINLNYLSLPVMAEIRVWRNLRLEVGPYFAVLLSSKQSFNDLIGDGAEILDTSAASTNSFDVGFGVGGSYHFPSGLGLGFRYMQGFTNALGNDFFGGASGSNTIVQPSLYYIF